MLTSPIDFAGLLYYFISIEKRRKEIDIRTLNRHSFNFKEKK